MHSGPMCCTVISILVFNPFFQFCVGDTSKLQDTTRTDVRRTKQLSLSDAGMIDSRVDLTYAPLCASLAR